MQKQGDSQFYEAHTLHCKKWVVVITIRYGYLSCNLAIFVTTRGIYIYRISIRNDVCISQDTPCNIISHRGSHVHNPTVLYFCIKCNGRVARTWFLRKRSLKGGIGIVACCAIAHSVGCLSKFWQVLPTSH